MIKAISESTTETSEEFDDVFDTIIIPEIAKEKKSLSKTRSLGNGCEKIYTLKDLNKSFDSDAQHEPYRRRGSVTRLEKRRPSTSNKPSAYVTFAEILSHFQNQDPMKMQRILNEQNTKQGNGKILGIFSPHPKLPANLGNEKDVFLLMAETK